MPDFPGKTVEHAHKSSSILLLSSVRFVISDGESEYRQWCTGAEIKVFAVEIGMDRHVLFRLLLRIVLLLLFASSALPARLPWKSFASENIPIGQPPSPSPSVSPSMNMTFGQLPSPSPSQISDGTSEHVHQNTYDAQKLASPPSASCNASGGGWGGGGAGGGGGSCSCKGSGSCSCEGGGGGWGGGAGGGGGWGGGGVAGEGKGKGGGGSCSCKKGGPCSCKGGGGGGGEGGRGGGGGSCEEDGPS